MVIAQLPVELRIIHIDRKTGKQFIVKLSSEDNTPLPSYTAAQTRPYNNHSAVGVGKINPTHSIVTYGTNGKWNIGLPMGYHD